MPALRTLAALIALSLVGSTTTDVSAAPAVPQITYAVHAAPGTRLSVAWTVPGQRAMPLGTATVPASGTWTATVPADGWQGGLFGTPTLSVLTDGVTATSQPGIDCTITQAGAPLARDNEPHQYACLTSTDPTVNR